MISTKLVCIWLSMPLTILLPAAQPCGAGSAGLGAPEDLAFEAGFDGTAQRYVRMLPGGSATELRDVLIVLHGHGSDRWQYVKDGRGECRAARDFAATHGMIFISPDYRVSTSWMGPAAESDMVQLIALLKAKHRVRRIFLSGASMGGASVLIFAALHPDLIAGVASQNGTANMLEYDKFQDAIASSYGGDKSGKLDEYRMRSPELVPGKFAMPVAFAVGGRDSVVPPASVRRLTAALKRIEKRKVLLLDRKKGGHETSYKDTMKTLEFMLLAADRGENRSRR
jgi:pimeloyl-ACP methyl ester carboxylesterase